jgi:hypothetical protein
MALTFAYNVGKKSITYQNNRHKIRQTISSESFFGKQKIDGNRADNLTYTQHKCLDVPFD